MRTTQLTAAVLIGAFALVAGCSSTEESGTGAASGNTAAASPAPASEAAAPVGPACAGVPADGPGSVAAMATQPVATAAASNPDLSTLATAVTKTELATTLNEAPALTVFAPTNEAFAKIPKETLDKVLADKAALTKILTYHVVGSRAAPTELDGGSLATLQGGKLTTAKTGEGYSVNDAKVLCGNIQTRNATVYLIDSVLMPAA